MKKYTIEITVFLCGALGMALELVAARVLSPYVGSSNLIWTIIIGVILTSMSLGYWIGGKLADKEPSKNRLSNLLLLGAISTSLIPILETTLVRNYSLISKNLIAIAFLSASIIFGIPSFVLATVSPYAVKLKEKTENIGKLSRKNISIINCWKHFWNLYGRFYFHSNFWSKNNYCRNYDHFNNIVYDLI